MDYLDFLHGSNLVAVVEISAVVAAYVSERGDNRG